MYLVISAAVLLILTMLGLGFPDKVGYILRLLNYEFWYYIVGSEAMLEDFLHRSSNKFEPVPKEGCIAVITGGARGIGVEVVNRLIECNISVIIGCRNVKAGNELVQKIRDKNSNVPEIKVYELDVSSLKSVRNFGEKVKAAHPKIHYLINNAGIMFGPYKETIEGFESQFAVNYLGHFLLTHLLLPCLRNASQDTKCRIVNVASCAHILGDMEFDDLMMKKNYMPSAAYARSKLAQVMFTKYLSKLCKKDGIDVFAVHPGIVNTELFNGTLLKMLAPWVMMLFFKNAVQGSQTIAYAAVAKELDGQTGVYLSNCRIADESKVANNEDLQEQLFQHSKKLCGITHTYGN